MALLTRREVLARSPFGNWKLNQLVAANEFPEPIRLPQINGAPGRICYWSEAAIDGCLAEYEQKQLAQFLPALLERRANDPFGRTGRANQEV